MAAHGPAPLVPEAALDELASRLRRTTVHGGSSPSRGIARDRLEQLLARWREDFRWSDVERAAESLGSCFEPVAEGRRMHLLRSVSSSSRGVPIVLLHGWPDSCLMFRALIPRLAMGERDVVAPSLPGFGWSDEHAGETSTQAMATDVHDLLGRLGYSRYVVHGTDWGGSIAAEMASMFPESVAGLHLTQPPFDRAFMVDRASLSDEELAYLTQVEGWAANAVHLSVHMLQADTLAAGLLDSPLGLLAWVAEKYDSWSGEQGVSDEAILTAVASLWFSRTARSSIRLYSEPQPSWEDPAVPSDEAWPPHDAADASWGSGRIDTPTAIAGFPDDIALPPRAYVERFFAVERYSTMPHGGHWGALEAPDALAADLLEFAVQLGG